MSNTKWIKRWKFMIATRPSMPGVWRKKEGGFLVRGRVKDPRTFKVREVLATRADADAHVAYAWLQEQLAAIRCATPTTRRAPTRFADYSVSLLARKVATGAIRSAKTRKEWGSVLTNHLIPRFGSMFVDDIRRADIESWRTAFALKIRAGDYSPHTGNDIFSILRVIINGFVGEFELERNPVTGVERFDTREHATYTEEEPNALLPGELPDFLVLLRRFHPQHFAMVSLGFATGLRPSSLRPLRRRGATPDILWNDGVLLVRRSHTIGEEVMEATKTGRDGRVALPDEMMQTLQWHVARLPAGPMRESDLLFPSETGSFRSTTVLQKPFDDIAKKMGLSKRITPRAMRRTFQDLCRVAKVKDVVTRAVSGHTTVEMQRHYSTVSGSEMRESLAMVVSLAGIRAAIDAGDIDRAQLAEPSGGKSGGKGRRAAEATEARAS